jgi:hypothetical protein
MSEDRKYTKLTYAKKFPEKHKEDNQRYIEEQKKKQFEIFNHPKTYHNNSIDNNLSDIPQSKFPFYRQRIDQSELRIEQFLRGINFFL